MQVVSNRFWTKSGCSEQLLCNLSRRPASLLKKNLATDFWSIYFFKTLMVRYFQRTPMEASRWMNRKWWRNDWLILGEPYWSRLPKSVFYWQFLISYIFYVSFQCRTCYITRQLGQYVTIYFLFCSFCFFFIAFHDKICVFIIFSSFCWWSIIFLQQNIN